MSDFADRPAHDDLPDGEILQEEGEATAAAEPGAAFADGRTLIVALRGWNDAGDAASDAAIALRKRLADTSELLWTCDDEDFFDYSLHRPVVQTTLEGDRAIIWPAITVTGPTGEAGRGEQLADDAELRVSGGNRDIFVLTGIEPTLRWRSFAARVLEFVDEHRIDRIVLVGALLNDSPHSRPVTIFASSDDAEVRRELDVRRSEYEGPTGMLGVLAAAARARGDLRSLSLWAAVPHYAHAAPSPKATSALLDRLEEVLDVSIPHPELLEEAERWEREIDEMAASDEDIAEYVAVLEQTYDMVEAPEASGEAIAKEFERFLQQSSKSARPSKPLRRPGRAPADWSRPGQDGERAGDAGEEPSADGMSGSDRPDASPDGDPEA